VKVRRIDVSALLNMRAAERLEASVNDLLEQAREASKDVKGGTARSRYLEHWARRLPQLAFQRERSSDA
jgi:hypothetical protein